MEVFRIAKVVFHIWPDDHRPAHVHVVGPDVEAKIEFEPEVRTVRARGFSARDLRQLEAEVTKRRVKLKEKWDEIEQSQQKPEPEKKQKRKPKRKR